MNWKQFSLMFLHHSMNKEDVDNKIPIYKLTTKDEILRYYNQWSKNSQFNKDMVDWNYTAPQNVANLLDKYTNDKSIKILDAGCGSGLAGKELKKLNYLNIHGADFSQHMLDLIGQDIYQSLELIDLNESLKYENENFDAITCVGTFTYGHVKAHCLDELIRIVKKKGLICFTINEGIYKEYKFDKKMDELSKNNFWKILEFSKSPYIVNKNIEAWLCLARKK